MPTTTRRPALRPDALYLGDNGRCFCGELDCAGQSSYYTGRDISGQRVLELRKCLTSTMIANGELDGFACEGCGKTVAR